MERELTTVCAPLWDWQVQPRGIRHGTAHFSVGRSSNYWPPHSKARTQVGNGVEDGGINKVNPTAWLNTPWESERAFVRRAVMALGLWEEPRACHGGQWTALVVDSSLHCVVGSYRPGRWICSSPFNSGLNCCHNSPQGLRRWLQYFNPSHKHYKFSLISLLNSYSSC